MASNSSSVDEARRWIQVASGHAAELKQTLTANTDFATAAAGSALTSFLSSSTAFIQETKGTMEWAKNEYMVYEDLAVAKIKGNHRDGLSVGKTISSGFQAADLVTSYLNSFVKQDAC